ncbi:MAG: ClpXP protease specificity-enhancing factor [Zoogloeaceae bacterium]|jgi:stringent starvation protein B|nr:ClpXP protease specificity-enhancing factor [Zoogloeaceae bacterium]
MSADKLPSTKPYFVRAIWEWCNDNGFTPYLAVTVDASCRVPQEFVKESQIVLNIGADATHKLQMQNDAIFFQARFGGVAREIYVPMTRVAAIYARENGNGMAFEVETTEPSAATGGEDNEPKDTPPPSGRSGRAHLQRVK